MQVRLLGPVDVVVHGEHRPVPGLRRKTVLAVLALHSGEVVSTDQLVDAAWGDAPPPSVLNSLQTHLSYLRGVLGAKDAILARRPGYVLKLPGDGTDVRVAKQLLEQATRSAGPAGAVRHLRDALALWRGRPLADVAELAWLSGQAEQLDLLRMRIKLALAEAMLAAGEYAQLIPELEQMAADHPLDERMHAQLMLALYRSGRQSDALAVFQRLRRTLAGELGIDPGRALRDLETAILRQDSSLDAPAAEVTPASPVVTTPAQLPPAVPVLIGRDAELASLDAMVPPDAQAEGASPAAVAVSVVSGTAGVGKTALAVYWAHRAAARFPDGQLYVNLRGFDPGAAAMDPAQALGGFLEALGVPATGIPEDLAAQGGLFRSLLASKRVLVVLDNAHDAEQVRPLLPGSPGCLAIVTSRDQLVGLLVTENARPLALDLLSAADACDLLAQRLSAGRVAAEPEAAGRIIAACAQLPLALTLAAARAATSPTFPLAAIAAELSDATNALDPFDGGDHATNVRAVFSWSYRALSSEAARMFRLLGLHPGPDISLAAAASLAAVQPGQARALLAELTRAHLLAEHSPRRYGFHDLLRAYACELAQGHDDQDARDAAVDRVLGHYVHVAHAAMVLIEQLHNPLPIGPLRSGVIAAAPATTEEAMGWFAAEQATLLAAVEFAARSGLSTPAWQLAWTLSAFLLRRGLWRKAASACQAALDAARLVGDTEAEAHSLHRLALGYAKSGRDSLAESLFEDALPLLEALDDKYCQAMIYRTRYWFASRRGQPLEMLTNAQRCYELFLGAGHQAGQALALMDIGQAHAKLGNYAEAIAHGERSLAAMQSAGQHALEGAVWYTLGTAHHLRGDYPRAIACYQRAVDIAREIADPFNEADTLSSLGEVYRSAGDLTAARRAWTQALRLFDEIDHPDRDLVRAKLLSPGRAPAAVS